MLQLENNTPFIGSLAIFPDAQGSDTLFVSVKATFTIARDGSLKVATAQVPVTVADLPWGKPGKSSLKYASELHLGKPGTDVVVIGTAHAPEGELATRCDVAVSVGEQHSIIRVIGDRQWRHGLWGCSASAPEEFTTMPLTYERAYGGVHVTDESAATFLAEERNPVGAGFRGKRAARDMDGMPLPNLEDPTHLITSISSHPAPICWGFVHPAWLPRRSFAGTYDAAWQRTRAPFLPGDFDARYFTVGHQDLRGDAPLVGGEIVTLTNLTSEGMLSFALPTLTWSIAASISGVVVPCQPVLETCLIEPDAQRLCLTWRASTGCEKKALKVQKVQMDLRSMALSPVGGAHV